MNYTKYSLFFQTKTACCISHFEEAFLTLGLWESPKMYVGQLCRSSVRIVNGKGPPAHHGKLSSFSQFSETFTLCCYSSLFCFFPPE